MVSECCGFSYVIGPQDDDIIKPFTAIPPVFGGKYGSIFMWLSFGDGGVGWEGGDGSTSTWCFLNPILICHYAGNATVFIKVVAGIAY